MILADGALGQMMEKVVLPEEGSLKKVTPAWASTGKTPDRDPNIITSLYLRSEEMEVKNNHLQKKYEEIQKEVKFETIDTEEADILLVAFGLSARICQKTMELAREKGIKAGLFRPVTLYPFPYKAIEETAAGKEFVLTVEMNAGQMVEDVRLAVNGKRPVYHKGRMGGIVPSPEEILKEIETLLEKHTQMAGEVEI
jgi:2-oxoglutarate ferredoxin oxidoreductase subunit alpha